jgi:acyl-CoA synthetase (AMP-forming)/AMP-acid ligase II
VLTHLNLISSALHFEIAWRLTAEDRALMAVPTSHVTGLVAILLAMVRVGGAVVFMRTFKSETFLRLAAAERMTYTLMVPAMYNLILLQSELADHDLSAWRLGGYGGAPMAPATVSAVAAKLPGLELVTAYGATETASPATLTPLGDAAAHVRTVGRAAACSEIRVVREDGSVTAPGASGEIWIRGPQVSPGYWNRPDATAEAFHDGFWRSGDIGSLDADGWLELHDRRKDVINRAGFKVYPAEVEHVLAALDGVLEAAVVGRPDPVLGEKSHAFVVRRDDHLTALQVQAHCRALLSDYKVPDFITFLAEALPRNANGKVLKPLLRERNAREAAKASPSFQAAQGVSRGVEGRQT